MSSGFFFSFSPSKLLSHTYIRIRCISLCFVSFHDHWCPLVGRWVSISGIPSSRPYIHSSSPALLLRHVTAQHCTLPYPDLPYPTLTYLLPHRTAVTLTCPSVPFLSCPDLTCLCLSVVVVWGYTPPRGGLVWPCGCDLPPPGEGRRHRSKEQGKLCRQGDPSTAHTAHPIPSYPIPYIHTPALPSEYST